MSTRSARYNTLAQHTPKGRMLSGPDRDAAAFLEAAGIVATHQQRAIYELVRLLKQYGLWSKMKAIYPFVGGTATTHKWNLKDPRDQDAAFRLTFSGGWTHSSTGADPNGSNAYADTFCKPSTSLSQNSTHISFYSREAKSGLSGVQIGCTSISNANRLLIQIGLSSNTYAIVNSTPPNDWAVWTDTSEKGFYIANRTVSNTVKGYQNNTTYSATVNSSGLATYNLYIAAYNQAGTLNFYQDQQCAFATIGDGLTDDEAANLYNAVQRYQQLLGRAV